MASCIARLLGGTVTLLARVEKPEWTVSWSNTQRCDRAGRLWFVETSLYPNQLVDFNPKMTAFFGDLNLHGGGATRHMFFYAFTCTRCAHANPIVCVRLPEACVLGLR
ncbi:MAG: hypothetical protein Q9M35_05360 [Rhodothermus sp.]|nr:hypothetical protein [Rhodothermus sp.]